jgi:hypothetical protein
LLKVVLNAISQPNNLSGKMQFLQRVLTVACKNLNKNKLSLAYRSEWLKINEQTQWQFLLLVKYLHLGSRPSWSWLYGSWIYNYLCLSQVDAFLQVLWFTPSIKLNATI